MKENIIYMQHFLFNFNNKLFLKNIEKMCKTQFTVYLLVKLISEVK